MGNIGAFGGCSTSRRSRCKEPVLVSGTDGVGTKLKLAFEMDKHDTIGIDAVAMCVNDVLAQGAEPLLFLDYVAVGHNEPQKIEGHRGGRCRRVPPGGLRPGGRRDGRDAGHVCRRGVRHRRIYGGRRREVEARSTVRRLRMGDVLVGIASSGVHSNGFSLVRKIVADNCLDSAPSRIPSCRTSCWVRCCSRRRRSTSSRCSR